MYLVCSFIDINTIDCRPIVDRFRPFSAQSDKLFIFSSLVRNRGRIVIHALYISALLVSHYTTEPIITNLGRKKCRFDLVTSVYKTSDSSSGTDLLSDAQPSRVARSIRSEERSSEQRWINIVNQAPTYRDYSLRFDHMMDAAHRTRLFCAETAAIK